MDTKTFAQKIKAKYPAYQNIDDATLVNKIIEKYPEYKSQVNVQSETSQDISQTGKSIVNTVNQGVDKYSEIQARQDAGLQGGLRTKLQQLGVGAGTASGVIGDVLTGAIKTVLPQSAENTVKSGLQTVTKPIIESAPVQSIMSKYEELKQTNPKLAQDISSALGFAQLGLDVTGIGETAGLVKTGIKKGVQLAEIGTEQLAKGISKTIQPIKSTIEDAGTSFIKRVSEPDVSQATKVSLNPSEALRGTKQDIQVSIGGKLKNISEATPQEIEKLKVGTAKNVDNFTVQAEKFANDRGVKGGSPVEIVGQRTDRVLDIADKKRQSIGSKMGAIEQRFADTVVPMQENTFKQFADIVDYSKNPKYGVSSQNAPVVQEFINNFDTLNASGLTVKERNDFIRNWTEYLRDAKDPFGNFKENATVNTKIQNAVNTLKTETVDAIPDKTYRNLRKQYAEYKKLDEIGNQLLGKDGALGERVKGAATVKRAIQSNSDAGARQFLIKLKQLTGYDAIKEGDLALTAMENVGDYQGLSLLNIIQEGKTGIINKALEKGQDILVGDKATRVKKYIRK